MSKQNHSSRSNESNKPRKQRALILQGGGTLGAYEAGVLEILCKTLSEDDKKKNKKDGLLFDIVAGSSIGAMNGAVLVSNFLNTHSWEKAVEKLQKFWIDQLAVKDMDVSEISKPWYDGWKSRVDTAASPEAARRYYSVKNLLVNQVRNNMYYVSEDIKDYRFFDNLKLCDQHPECNCNWIVYNEWYVHSILPLQQSIQNYASLPISTSIENNQPRLLVFSVDVAEGVTVTFDSYPKADGSRKSEYKGKSSQNKKAIVIKYNNGITIDHIMASGTIPEFYKYAKVPMDSMDKQKNQDSTTGDNEDEVHYFTDGGVLSNTPFRELLSAHREYWKDVREKKCSPGL
jgi:predicted acylesterase/phospholipase RssA